MRLLRAAEEEAIHACTVAVGWRLQGALVVAALIERAGCGLLVEGVQGEGTRRGYHLCTLEEGNGWCVILVHSANM